MPPLPRSAGGSARLLSKYWPALWFSQKRPIGLLLNKISETRKSFLKPIGLFLIQRGVMNVRLLVAGLLTAGFTWGQANSMDPLRYSVATPRPVNPADGTTNPSAQATQRQNPYLGSVPQKSTGANLDISLNDAVQRGLRYNLGLVDAGHASADVRAARLRALSAMLPQIT